MIGLSLGTDLDVGRRDARMEFREFFGSPEHVICVVKSAHEKRRGWIILAPFADMLLVEEFPPYECRRDRAGLQNLFNAPPADH